MTPRLNRDGSVRQDQGGGSRHAVQRVVRRLQFDGDQRGELHLTLCEHGTEGREPCTYLHFHTFTRRAADTTKPVAFNRAQLGLLIAELRSFQEEMQAGKARVARLPAADAPDEPPRRVRGRRPATP